MNPQPFRPQNQPNRNQPAFLQMVDFHISRWVSTLLIAAYPDIGPDEVAAAAKRAQRLDKSLCPRFNLPPRRIAAVLVKHYCRGVRDDSLLLPLQLLDAPDVAEG